MKFTMMPRYQMRRHALRKLLIENENAAKERRGGGKTENGF